MKTEEEIKEELEETKKCIADREEFFLYQMNLGYINALEWVLESEEE